MSADRIFCYDKQRLAIMHFMHEIGSIVQHVHPISDHHDLDGLSHITFAVIDGHLDPIPQRMWEAIERRGAVVIHFDDQYARRLAVRHYHPGTDKQS